MCPIGDGALRHHIHELDGLSCGFLSLGESWCDTTTSHGRLMLTIMGGIAQFERSRCEEGIKRAKDKGTKFGLKRSLSPEQVKIAADRYAKGETMAELAEVYGVSEPTIWRSLHRKRLRRKH